MSKHIDSFSQILQMISAEEFRTFAIDYGMSHPEMVEALKKKYSKLLKGTEKIDIDKEVKACFEEYVTSPRSYNSRRWEPEEIDWETTEKNIHRLLKRATIWAEGNNPSQAIELGLKLLEEIVRNVGTELQWNQDFYPDDECSEEVLSLLKTAMANKQTSRADKLAVADRLDKICRMEAFDYGWDEGGVEEFAANIRKENLTPDEQLEVLHRQYNDETREYSRGDKLREIWDFLLALGRPKEAEKLYHEHLYTDALLERYGLLLENQKRDQEALDFYISRHTKSPYNYQWLWGQYRIYRRCNNKDGMLTALRELFKNPRTRLEAYKELKREVAINKWNDELQSLISKSYPKGEFDNLLGTILVDEQLIDQLYIHILEMRSDPLSYILDYKKHFSSEQLSNLSKRMERFLKPPYMRFNLDRKGYQYLASRVKNVAKLCPTGHTVAKSVADFYLTKYSNRPALRDELQKAKLC